MENMNYKMSGKTIDAELYPSDIILQSLNGMVSGGHLYVMDFATGGGKTFASFEMSTRYGLEKYRKIFYIVPQVKQRDNASDEMRKAAVRNGFDLNNCLILESTLDHLIHIHENGIWKRLALQLNQLKEKHRKDQEITGSIERVQETADELQQMLTLYQNNVRAGFIISNEKTDEEQYKLFNRLSTRLKKLLCRLPGCEIIVNSEDEEKLVSNINQCKTHLPCLLELFPWLEIYNKRIILLTAMKLMHPLRMVVNPEIVLYNSNLITDSLFLLDESDAVYVDMVNALIKQTSDRTVPHLYEVVTTLRKSFVYTQGNVPRSHYQPDRLEKIISKTVERIDYLLDEMGLEHYHLVHMPDIPEEHTRYSVFSSIDHHSILPKNVDRICISSDRENQYQRLTLVTTSVKDQKQKGKEGKEATSGGNVVPMETEGKGTDADTVLSDEVAEPSCGPGEKGRGDAVPADNNLYPFAVKLQRIIRQTALELSAFFRDYFEYWRHISLKESVGSHYRYSTYEEIVEEVLYTLSMPNVHPTLMKVLDILGNIYHQFREVPSSKEDLSFYNEGWLMMNIHNPLGMDKSNQKIRDFTFFRMNHTPEKILLNLVKEKNNTVVLLSATAAIESLSTNFNVHYLKRALGKRYHALQKETLDRFHEAVENSLPSPTEWKIDIYELPRNVVVKNSVELEEFIRVAADRLFEESNCSIGHRFLMELARTLMREYSKEKDSDPMVKAGYYLQRYYKFWYMYRSFMADASLHSGICFTYAIAREGMEESQKVSWNQAILLCGCAIIDGAVNEHNYRFGQIPDTAERTLRFMSTANYDAELETVRQEWKAGKKRLVVTSYKTAGAGMNVHHPVCTDYAVVGRLPSYMKDVPENKRQKDIDMIVLMDVTCYRDFTRNSNFRPIGQENVMKYIIHLLSLQYEGNLTYKDTRDEIRTVMTTHTSTLSNTFHGFAYDYQQYKLQHVKQALGRIARTTLKNPHTVIWYDAELEPCIRQAPEDSSYPLEFLQLKAHLTGGPSVRTDICPKLSGFELGGERMQQLVNLCNTGFHTINRYINVALQHYYDMEGLPSERSLRAQDVIERIRHLLLCNPTLSEECSMPIGQFLYLPVEGLKQMTYYAVLKDNEGNKGESDYETLSLLTCDNGKAAEVSSVSTRLDILMKNPVIRQWFKQRGYAVKWETGNWMMQPYIANCIYQGSIAEEAFAALVQHYFGLECHHPKGLMFETGDWTIANIDLLFDIKNYHPKHIDYRSEHDLSRNIRHKIQKSGRPLVFVNMLCCDERQQPHGEGNVHQIPGLLDPETGEVKLHALEYLQKLVNEYRRPSENDNEAE